MLFGATSMSGEIIGVYGKLPTHADFVTHNIESCVTEPLYDWIQRRTYEAREEMGKAEWLSAYLVSSPWRFVIPISENNRRLLLGVMIPSVDKVGRYFPLILAASIDDFDANVSWLFGLSGNSLYSFMEQAGISALQQRWDISTLCEYLRSRDRSNPNIDAQQVPVAGPVYEVDIINRMGEPLSPNNIGTIWWSVSDIYGGRSPVCTALDMPSNSMYQFMITGACEVL